MILRQADTIEEGVEFYKRSKQIMLQAGFNLRKWLTNSPELQNIIREREGTEGILIRTNAFSYVKLQNANNISESKKVLELEWETESGEFVFRSEEFVKMALELSPTKRNIFRVTASLYDPFGLISPITAGVKIIFQILCEGKYEWDNVVTDEIKTF